MPRHEQLLAIALLVAGLAFAAGFVRLLPSICLGIGVFGSCIGQPLDLNLMLGLGFVVFGGIAWWHAYSRTGHLIG